MTTRATRHFSMIRGFHLADFVTLGNAACGVGGDLLRDGLVGGAGIAWFFAAAALAPAAFLLDVLDGRIARARQQYSILGRELDSLADVISFGVAPAALGYAAGLDGGWDWVALIYFVCCGVSRLARYNVTAESLSGGARKVKYFEGTPIPTSIVLVGGARGGGVEGRVGDACSAAHGTRARDAASAGAAVRASGTLMISRTLRIPKF